MRQESEDKDKEERRVTGDKGQGMGKGDIGSQRWALPIHIIPIFRSDNFSANFRKTNELFSFILCSWRPC